MNLTCDTVLVKSSNFVNLRLLSVHTSNELGSVFIPTTKIRTLTGSSNWLPPGHSSGDVTADVVSRTESEQDYKDKTDFETRMENQYFGHQNNSMSQPPLGLTPLGTNTINRKNVTY